MEEIVAKHDAVAKCAVFGINCDLKGQKTLVMLILKSGVSTSHEQIQA